MSKTVRGGLIQATLSMSAEQPIEKVKQSMIEKHLLMIEQAAKKGVQILCMQELFYGPYFCAEQKTKWYSLVENIPDGPTIRLMQEVAKKYSMVIMNPKISFIMLLKYIKIFYSNKLIYGIKNL